MAEVDTRSVTIPFRSPRRDNKVWILSDVNDWQPQEMSRSEESYDFTFNVPKDRQALLYKFRIGDFDWANDPEAPYVPDGFGGINNRFEIPAPSVNLQPTELMIPPPVEHQEETLSAKQSLPESSDAKDVTVIPSHGSTHRTEKTATATMPKSIPTESHTPLETTLRQRAADLEDEAYHSSDDTTPKASRQCSISTRPESDLEEEVPKSNNAIEHLAEVLEVTTFTPSKLQDTEFSASKLSLEVPSAMESADSESDVTLIPEAIVPAQPKTATIPMYLGIAAITVTVLAYFLRLIREVFPLANHPRVQGPITKALKITAVTLVGIATVIEMVIEEVVSKQRAEKNLRRVVARSERRRLKQQQEQMAS